MMESWHIHVRGWCCEQRKVLLPDVYLILTSLTYNQVCVTSTCDLYDIMHAPKCLAHSMQCSVNSRIKIKSIHKLLIYMYMYM